MKKREKFKLFIKRILNKSKLINKTKLTELISKGNLNFKLPELKDTFTRLKNYSFFKKQIITLSNARDDFKKNIEKKYFYTY